MTISLMIAVANFIAAFAANLTGHGIICGFHIAIGILFVLVAISCEGKILKRIEKLEEIIRLRGV